MHILLLGKGGQVGWELQRALAPLGRVTALDRESPGPAEAPELRADFSQPEQVAALVRAIRPDVIVNAAALGFFLAPAQLAGMCVLLLAVWQLTKINSSAIAQ